MATHIHYLPYFDSHPDAPCFVRPNRFRFQDLVNNKHVSHGTTCQRFDVKKVGNLKNEIDLFYRRITTKKEANDKLGLADAILGLMQLMSCKSHLDSFSTDKASSWSLSLAGMILSWNGVQPLLPRLPLRSRKRPRQKRKEIEPPSPDRAGMSAVQQPRDASMTNAHYHRAGLSPSEDVEMPVWSSSQLAQDDNTPVPTMEEHAHSSNTQEHDVASIHDHILENLCGWCMEPDTLHAEDCLFNNGICAWCMQPFPDHAADCELNNNTLVNTEPTQEHASNTQEPNIQDHSLGNLCGWCNEPEPLHAENCILNSICLCCIQPFPNHAADCELNNNTFVNTEPTKEHASNTQEHNGANIQDHSLGNLCGWCNEPENLHAENCVLNSICLWCTQPFTDHAPDCELNNNFAWNEYYADAEPTVPGGDLVVAANSQLTVPGDNINPGSELMEA
ncbi:hypothetical protein AC578_9858 [Pseudocercospora eumusae]|uniref:Uncharacterized protein n=1 Tax=Pseudocercospora eumusae TaxID=321146 RepID=A0A139HAZ5_9PEZI|nr:hypothetical protein AC578_9858 [Pseudocercospora eumusae]